MLEFTAWLITYENLCWFLGGCLPVTLTFLSQCLGEWKVFDLFKFNPKYMCDAIGWLIYPLFKITCALVVFLLVFSFGVGIFLLTSLFIHVHFTFTTWQFLSIITSLVAIPALASLAAKSRREYEEGKKNAQR